MLVVCRSRGHQSFDECCCRALVFSMHVLAASMPPTLSKLTKAKPRDSPVSRSRITRTLSCKWHERPAQSKWTHVCCTLRSSSWILLAVGETQAKTSSPGAGCEPPNESKQTSTTENTTVTRARQRSQREPGGGNADNEFQSTWCTLKSKS